MNSLLAFWVSPVLLKPDKTKFMLHSSRQLLSQLRDFRLSLREKCFLPEKVIKYFGVTFDPNLTF